MAARVTIKRKAWPLADLMRAYTIWIDDKEVGSVMRRKTKSLEVEPGHHTIGLKIDWCTSPLLEFDVDSGDEVFFVCRAQGTSTTLYSLARPSQYIRFEQVASLG
jgi:hypothetical protein